MPPSSNAYRAPSDQTGLGEVVIFYGLVLALTCAATAMLWTLPQDFRAGDVGAIRLAVGRVGAVVVYLPAAAGLACTLIFGGWRGLAALLRRLVIVRISPVYYLIALIAPIAPQWFAAILWAQMAGVELSYPEPMSFLAYWAQVTLIGTLVLLGEEIGWRGFMLPRLLQRFGWRSASLIAGMLWAVWHFPFWAPANYAATGSVPDTAIILLSATLGAMALSVMITWLFIRARYSIAIAALLHASGNASMGKVYEMLGDGAAGPSWPILCNALLIALATVFLLLPDLPTSTAHDAAVT